MEIRSRCSARLAMKQALPMMVLWDQIAVVGRPVRLWLVLSGGLPVPLQLRLAALRAAG